MLTEIGPVGPLAEVYGAAVSKDTVCKITDNVVEEMNDWANRPLDPAGSTR